MNQTRTQDLWTAPIANRPPGHQCRDKGMARLDPSVGTVRREGGSKMIRLEKTCCVNKKSFEQRRPKARENRATARGAKAEGSVYIIIPKISNKQLHWSRECIQFATGHGPVPSYLKRFCPYSKDNCGCGEIENPLHYATRCPLTLSYHHKEASPQFIVHWWKSALSSKLSRRNIDHLITFLATNKDLIKRQNTTPSHSPA
ncbi:hypothetical protein AVEN_145719-1 [Araneus ventricosus]|uniref:Uncharacterized protein n=1 Tax=Araneus ventricosus TaxID=182803 RepID=A0A4Y2SY98_ARAVE|nr:hypothetical protein AVEN_145719-1 [Araneus ventricosus]